MMSKLIKVSYFFHINYKWNTTHIYNGIKKNQRKDNKIILRLRSHHYLIKLSNFSWGKPMMNTNNYSSKPNNLNWNCWKKKVFRSKWWKILGRKKLEWRLWKTNMLRWRATVRGKRFTYRNITLTLIIN